MTQCFAAFKYNTHAPVCIRACVCARELVCVYSCVSACVCMRARVKNIYYVFCK